MYEAWFGLSQRPFLAVPQPDDYFPGAAVDAALQTVFRCVQRGEGTAVVIGPSGTGKSLLCQVLARQFNEAFRVVLLDRGPQETRRGLLQSVLHELGQPYRGLDESELRLTLADYLKLADDCPSGILLLVDEAHGYPLRVLDEMRALTNLSADGQPRVRLVLVGSGTLEERLASPKLDSFGQRIVARCYLEPLNRGETQDYIQDHLRRAGGSVGTIFPIDACHSVHRATDGVPRLVNQLCDHALLLAYANENRQVDSACVEEAWADLQQLPTPWNGEKQACRPSADVIEFGSLDTDDDRESLAQSEPTVNLLRVTSDDEEAAVEPIEQIERIESTLASLEGEFEPAGSIGPEVELVFTDPCNPFDEHFEEEEPVVDRYTGDFSADDRPAVTFPLLEVEPAVGRIVSVNQEAASVVGGVWPQALDQAENSSASLPDDDSNIMTIEDHYDEVQVEVRPVTPVRHQEYRRLFARLRHG